MINLREIILGALMDIVEEEQYSHIVLKDVLEKYQYLDKRDRAFITRVTEGTLENMLQMDYIIERFSKVKVENMKPVIRNILRMSVYQLKYMDSVPDSAVCNEGVRLAQKRGFYQLKGFVNGVLRSVARNLDKVEYPSKEKQPLLYLSVTYSMPEWIVKSWCELYGFDAVEKICKDMHEEKPTSIRCNLDKTEKEQIIESLKEQGIQVEQSPYLDYALGIRGYNYMKAVLAFKRGWFQVQDVSSMLVSEIAAPKWGDYCIDVCAAPGGKSLHMGDKMEGYGTVDARDVSQYKVNLIEENIQRTNSINVQAKVQDATVFDQESELLADIVIADVPCSGYGVIGKKPEIKYRVTPQKQEEIVILQRTILDRAANYVKPRGELIFSTCTIAKEENEENMMWFLQNYPFKLESLDPYLPEELHSETTALGYLQLLPGVHKTDGFFIAKFRRK